MLAAGAASSAGLANELPSVASINLCADQLVLALATPEQILSVSWLSADPHESLFASAAAGYPVNFGSAEEMLRFDPDVVIAGAFTNAFTRALLARLGYTVIELAPEDSIADVETNVRRVADAIGRGERAREVIAAMHGTMRRLEAGRPARPPAAVVVRPGGFTVGADSLADQLMTLAGLRNVAAEQGLDRWGSLSMETLLRSAAEVVVLTAYRDHEPSIANTILAHPALARMRATHPTAHVPAAYWACGLPESLHSAELLQQVTRK